MGIDPKQLSREVELIGDVQQQTQYAVQYIKTKPRINISKVITQ
jgi:hypothetical protein